MYGLDATQFQDLSEFEGGACVSIYMPTHRAGPDTIQDRKLLRNLLDAALERFIACGLRRPAAQELLEPAASLVDNSDFWQHQDQGLALFLASGRHWRVHLPHPTKQLLVVSRRFHITPLLPMLAEDGRFWVLGLSGNLVRLLHCTRGSVGQATVPRMPGSFQELDRYIDDNERQLQLHTVGAPTGGLGRGAVFHGQGQASDDRQFKKWLVDYCHLIDKYVTAYLHADTAPLVLAAAEPIHSIYRHCNNYPHLLPDGIVGNTDHATEAELHDKAWAIVRPHMLNSLDRVRHTYGDAAGQNAASDDLRDILFAAQDGRVGLLMVAQDDHVWGRYAPATGEVRVGKLEEPPDEDLLNTAAILTQRTGGQVFALPEEQMPNGVPIAAVFRY